MKEKTENQVLRLIHKITSKFPLVEDPEIITDIHIRVNQDTGDVMAFDDDDKEITRVVVNEWIENTDSTEEFYASVTSTFRTLLCKPVDNTPDSITHGNSLGLSKPYSFVLENETGEHIEELFYSDDSGDTIIMGKPLMESLSKELDDFMKELFD